MPERDWDFSEVVRPFLLASLTDRWSTGLLPSSEGGYPVARVKYGLTYSLCSDPFPLSLFPLSVDRF